VCRLVGGEPREQRINAPTTNVTLTGRAPTARETTMAKKTITAEQLLANIKRYPGYTMAAHAEDFGLTAADLIAQRLKLVRSGQIRSTGNTRSATWRVA
jgi:hypothetical protein